MPRKSARAPLSPWIGRFSCPDCGQAFAFVRHELGNVDNAYAQVAHVHDEQHPEGLWTLSVFRRRKGQHYPQDVRALRLVVQEQQRR
jgi:hypothetical protein